MKKSLGTLAAVVALAAASHTASADVQYATHLFGDIINPSNPDIDINNDGIVDYELLNSNRLWGAYYPLDDLHNVVAASDYDALKFAFGDTIDSSLSYQNYGHIDIATPSIIGLGFYIGQDFHYAWLQLGLDGSSLIILDGAWQSAANTGLGITPVPEPSTVAAGIALLAGAATLLRRRLRRHAA